MKKKFLKLSVLPLAAALLVGCSGTSEINFSGSYWNENPLSGGVSAVDETVEYSVSSVYKGEFSSTEMKNDGLELVVDQSSSYVTRLRNEGSEYVYTTVFDLKGKYVYDGGKEYSFDDYTTEIETRFKGLDDGLSPIKTEIKARNVVPLSLEPKGEDSFMSYGFTATVEYGEKAVITVISDEDSGERLFRTEPVEISKYASGAFLDDNLMIFAFSAMNFGTSYSQNFNTIDIMSGSLKEVSCVNISSLSATQTEQQVTPVRLEGAYVENCAPYNSNTFDTYGICFKTLGTYGKTFRYVYYAVNEKDPEGKDLNNATRHRPVLIYAPQIFNTGYFRFAIKEVRTA